MGVPSIPGGMRAGVIFSLAIPGGILPMVGRGPAEFAVLAGDNGGGGFAGLKLAAGGLLLAVAAFRIFAFMLPAVEPQAAAPAAPNISRHLTYLISFSLLPGRPRAFSRL